MSKRAREGFRSALRSGKVSEFLARLPLPQSSSEPWVYDGLSAIHSIDGRIGGVKDWEDQNVRRMLTCVNACKGLGDPEVEVAKMLRGKGETREE